MCYRAGLSSEAILRTLPVAGGVARRAEVGLPREYAKAEGKDQPKALKFKRETKTRRSKW
ncbi:hypothetical protein CCAX7_27380 [Capsulimonas corticalis]|uniref:Uncharacterized protein n=1 Tax=Capsulimonas corticalis TaxID=2219043 RepID=A0A402CTJ7_9BACT|nr:hypothetical protein CCAX7_27380 [Capsulimonas corticalis]